MNLNITVPIEKVDSSEDFVRLWRNRAPCTINKFKTNLVTYLPYSYINIVDHGIPVSSLSKTRTDSILSELGIANYDINNYANFMTYVRDNNVRLSVSLSNFLHYSSFRATIDWAPQLDFVIVYQQGKSYDYIIKLMTLLFNMTKLGNSPYYKIEKYNCVSILYFETVNPEEDYSNDVVLNYFKYTYEGFESFVQLLKNIPFTEETFKNNLATALDVIETNSLNSFQTTKDRMERDLHEYLSLYNQKLLELNNLQLRKMFGSDDCMKSLETLLYTLYKNHKISYLSKPFESNARSIDVNIVSPIFNYDEDLVKKIISNKSFKNDANFYKLLELVFLDNKYQLYTETPIHIDFYNYSTHRTSIYSVNLFSPASDASDIKYTDYVDNPHIKYYDCFGQNATFLSKLLKDNKYEEYFQYLIGTCANLNFGDYTVLDRFRNDLNTCVGRSAKTFIRVSDGEAVSFEEIIKEN